MRQTTWFVALAVFALGTPIAAQQTDTLPRDSVSTLPTIEVVGSILPPGGPGIRWDGGVGKDL